MKLDDAKTVLWTKAAMISILAVFAPIGGMLAAVFALVLADLVTGVLSAVKRKEPITSSALRRTVVKLLLYESAIVLAFICENWLTGALLPLSKLAAGCVGIVEIISVLENLNFLTGGTIFQPLLDRLSPHGPRGFPGPRGEPGAVPDLADIKDAIAENADSIAKMAGPVRVIPELAK